VLPHQRTSRPPAPRPQLATQPPDSARISHWTHFGGLLAGMCLSYVFLPNLRDERWERLKLRARVANLKGLLPRSLTSWLAAAKPANESWCAEQQHRAPAAAGGAARGRAAPPPLGATAFSALRSRPPDARRTRACARITLVGAALSLTFRRAAAPPQNNNTNTNGHRKMSPPPPPPPPRPTRPGGRSTWSRTGARSHWPPAGCS